MPNPIATTPSSKSAFDHPIFLAPRILLHPLVYVIEKVKRVVSIALGYLASIGVFSFGAWNNSWLKRKIIEGYKWVTGSRLPFEKERLIKAFSTLENIGGIRCPTFSKDGTKLDTMILRYKDIKAKLENYGWKIHEKHVQFLSERTRNGKEWSSNFKEVATGAEETADILLPDKKNPKWPVLVKYLDNLGLETATIILKDGTEAKGYVTSHWEIGAKRPKEGLCFLRGNSPTESYPMAKRDIIRRVLGLRGNVICWDPPGTWKSGGIATEGGYYLAAETMIEKAVNEYGYNWKDIWAEGFCLGGAVAIHLFKKYHNKEINLFTQNSFNSMHNTFLQQITFWPLNKLVATSLNEIQSRDPRITKKVEQDCFNSLHKLANLSNKQGCAIIINTDSDRIIDPASNCELTEALEKVARVVHSYVFPHPDQKRNGHGYDVLSEPEVWDKRVVKWMAEACPST